MLLKIDIIIILSQAGRYCHPIYSNAGGWHPIIKEAYDKLSNEQGLRRSKLPDLTAEEIKLIQGKRLPEFNFKLLIRRFNLKV